MLNDLPSQLMKVPNEVALIGRQWYKWVNAQPYEKGSVGMEASLQERTQCSSRNVGQGACLEVRISAWHLRGVEGRSHPTPAAASIPSSL